MEKSRTTYTLEEATRLLERYCSYQDRCHSEVVSKLRKMHMIPEAIDTIMGSLIKNEFLNEERFARSYARGKFKIKKWGRNRIVFELKSRNISKYNINAALREIDDEAYFATLEELANKRLAQLREPNAQKRRRKLADYLLYRGWESHLVYEKVRELIN